MKLLLGQACSKDLHSCLACSPVEAAILLELLLLQTICKAKPVSCSSAVFHRDLGRVLSMGRPFTDGPKSLCRDVENTSCISVSGLSSCQNMYCLPQNGPDSPNSLHRCPTGFFTHNVYLSRSLQKARRQTASAVVLLTNQGSHRSHSL